MVATTIKQSKRLLELGVEPNTADMYWQYIDGKGYLYAGRRAGADIMPAWSVEALMELRPNLMRYYNPAVGKLSGKLCFCKYADDNGDILHKTVGNTCVDAAVAMIEWFFENGYLTASGIKNI